MSPCVGRGAFGQHEEFVAVHKTASEEQQDSEQVEQEMMASCVKGVNREEASDLTGLPMKRTSLVDVVFCILDHTGAEAGAVPAGPGKWKLAKKHLSS